jgi:tripartite-type tricarboxylate transporter receptor subunit TctC
MAADRLRVPAVAAKQIDAAPPDMPTAREEGRVQIAGVWFGGFSARVSQARSSIF